MKETRRYRTGLRCPRRSKISMVSSILGRGKGQTSSNRVLHNKFTLSLTPRNHTFTYRFPLPPHHQLLNTNESELLMSKFPMWWVSSSGCNSVQLFWIWIISEFPVMTLHVVLHLCIVISHSTNFFTFHEVLRVLQILM